MKFASVDTMHEDIVSMWNSQVKPEDTVYNLGDLAFKTGQREKDLDALLKSLNGTQILIKGNHDETKKIAKFSAITELHKDMVIEIGGIKFLMAHFPFKESMPAKDVVERPECFTPGRLGEDGQRMPLLHGHTHDLFTMKPGSLCLCWDRWHRLVNEDEILDIYKDTNGFKENLDKYNNMHGGIR
jgi:calcineurin-like phosphoesterase family protein